MSKETDWSTLNKFVRRMEKLDITIELVGNYPWIYLHKINGKKVLEKFQADHGFTIAFMPVNANKPVHFTDITEIFKIIRKYKVM